MPPDFNTIQDEYHAWQQANPGKQDVDLGTYARMADSAQGTNERAIAYHPGIIQQVNAGIDRFFRPAGVSLAQDVGAPIDRTFGTGQTVQGVMQGTPRALAEALSYFTGGGELSGAARLASWGAKGAALTDAALRGSAEDPAHPIAGAAISAASLPLGGLGANLGGKVGASLVTRGLSKAAAEGGEALVGSVNPLAEKLASFAGEMGGVGLANTGVQEAQSFTDTGRLINPLTKENIVGNVAGILPFAPKLLHDFMRPTSDVVAQHRANVLEPFHDALAQTDMANQELQKAAEGMPQTAAADTVVEDLAKQNQAKTLSQYMETKKSETRAFESTAPSESAIAKVFVDGPPRQVQENFDDLITNPSKEAQARLEELERNPPTPVFKSVEDLQANPPKPGEKVELQTHSPTGKIEIQFASFDPAKVEGLSKVDPAALTDPTTLAKFMHDVNEQLAARWIEETKRVQSDPFFRDETRPGREAPVPQMLNPAVLEQLNTEGKIPKIDSQKLSDKYNEFLASSPTADPVEAWNRTVQHVSNVMLELGETAKAQKDAQTRAQATVQQTSQKLTEAQRDEAHYANVKTLPPELQEKLATQEVEDRQIKHEETAKPQWAWGQRRKLVDQAVKNFDPTTGQTKLTFRTQQEGGIVPVEKTMPLADAVLSPVGKRGLPAELGGSTKETSLEGMQEAGLQQAAREQGSAATSQTEEEGEGARIVEDETGKTFLGHAEPEPPEIGAGLGSRIEPNLPSESLNRVKEVYDSIRDPANEGKTWAAFKDIFTDPRGQIKGGVRTRTNFPLAVEAMLAGPGSEARAAFAKQYLRQDTVTPNDSSRAVANYWSKEGRWEAVQKRIGELAGLRPDEIQAMGQANVDYGLRSVHAEGELQTVAQSLPQALTTHFRMLGYGPALTQRFTDIGVALSQKFGDLADRLKFGELGVLDPLTQQATVQKIAEHMSILGLHGNYYVDAAGQKRPNPLIAIAVGHAARDKSFQPIADFLTSTVVAHEMVHDLQNTVAQDIQSPDKEVRARAQSLVDLQNLSASLPKEDKYALVRNIFDVVVPPELTRDATGKLRAEVAGYLSHAVSSDNEFVANYAQFYGAGIASRGIRLSDLRTALAWEPEAVYAFTKGIYRNVVDLSSGLEKMAQDPLAADVALGRRSVPFNAQRAAPFAREINERMRDLIKPDGRVIGSQQAIGDTAATISSGSLRRLLQEAPTNYRPDLMPSDAEFMARAGVVMKEFEPRGREALGVAKDFIFGTAKKVGNFWNEYFAPFSQVAAKLGTPVAKDATNILFSHQARQRRIVDQMLEPIQTRDKYGRLQFDDKSPVIQLWRGEFGDGAIGSFNKIQNLFQQWGDQGKLDFKKSDPNTPLSSSVRNNPTFAKEVLPLLQGLSPKNRTIMLAAGDQAAQVYQRSGTVRVEGGYESNSAKIARVVQTIMPEAPYDQALQRGTGIVQALRMNDAKALQTSLQGLDPARSKELINLAQTINAPLQDFEKQLAARPYFMSEARQGRFIVESVGKDGTKSTDGARDEPAAKELQQKLLREGATSASYYDKYEKFGQFAGDLPAEYANKFSQLETNAFQKSLAGIRATFGAAVADKVSADFDPSKAIQKNIASTTSQKYDMQRKLAGGRERLDYLSNMNQYVEGLARNLSNRKTKDVTNLLLNDQRMDAVPEFKQHTAMMLGNILTPTPESMGKLRTMLTGYQLGCQIAGPIVNPVQDSTIVLSQLVHQGDGVRQSIGRLVRGISFVGKAYLNPADNVRLAAEASRSADVGQMSQEHQKAFYLQKFQDEEPRVNQYDDLDLNAAKGFVDRARAGLGDSPLKSMGSLFGNGLYQGAAKLVKMYSWSTNLSTKAAFLAGFEQAHEQGLRGQQAYDSARRLVYTTTGGGGKANQIGLVAAANQSRPAIRTAVGLANVLQTFGLNLTSMYGRFASDALGADTSRSPVERRQAQKAFGVLLTTQTALAGALGVPFAAASLAGLEKVFGIQANAAVRQGLASLGGQDKELGATISDTVLNGLANQLFGIDVQAKTGLDSILGTSGYDGFNAADLLGPAPGMVGNAISAINDVRRGNPGRAASEIIPQGFRNLANEVDTSYRYGRPQLMDKQQNLIMTPTALQSVLYAIGFRPKELSQYQQAAGLLTTSSQLGAQVQERDIERLARGLIGGDTQSVRDYIDQVRTSNPMVNPSSLLDSVMEKVLDMQQQKDLLVGGSRQTAEQREQIAATYPQGAVPRQSETQRLVQKQNMLMSMGMPYGTQPAGAQEYMQAAIVDELTQSGMARTDAIRQAQLMMGARPYPQI